VYVGSGDNNLYAFDAATGALRWTQSTGGLVNSSPAVADGPVFVGSDDGEVRGFEATNGAVVSIASSAGPVWSSPAVANGIVYFGSRDGGVYANTESSSPLWTAGTSGPIAFSSPAVANGIVFIGSDDDKVYAFDAAGRQNCDLSEGYPARCTPLWTATTGGLVDSSPAVVNGTVYVGSGDGKVYAFALGGAG
jgi:outer membrane protein assembly factor BamB